MAKQPDPGRQNEEEKPAARSHQWRRHIAEKSSRDSRSLSNLGMIGLGVGVLLLICTVLIGMVPILGTSLILQDDFIRRMLFCVSVGLILASLGDYAFYGISKIFSVGGAAAIALGLYYILPKQPVEEKRSGRIRLEQTLKGSLYLVASDKSEFLGAHDSNHKTATYYNFQFPLSVAENLTRGCFTIVFKGDADSQSFEVDASNSRLPHSVSQVFDLIYDSRRKIFSHRSADGHVSAIAICPGTSASDTLPTQKDVQLATDASVNNPPSPDSNIVAWTYYGFLGENEGVWKERVYDNAGSNKAAVPKAGDQAEATTDIYLRKEPRKCRAVNDCDRLAESIGILKTGEKVTVNQVQKIFDKIWINVLVKR